MKSQHPTIYHLASRLAVALLIAFLLTSTVSCGSDDGFCKSSAEAIQHQFEDLKALITGRQTYADKAALWQTIAAVFIVLTGIAFVGGAGLGSRARKAQSTASTPIEPDNTPGSPADEIAQ